MQEKWKFLARAAPLLEKLLTSAGRKLSSLLRHRRLLWCRLQLNLPRLRPRLQLRLQLQHLLILTPLHTLTPLSLLMLARPAEDLSMSSIKLSSTRGRLTTIITVIITITTTVH